MPKSKRAKVKTLKKYGLTVSVKTGRPLGQKPKDPAKLKVWLKCQKEADDAEAQKQPTKAIIPAVVPESAQSKKSDSEILKIAEERFAVMSVVVKAVAAGQLNSAIFSSAPGIGKTSEVDAILAEFEENGEITVERHSGGNLTPIELYMLLHRNSAPNAVVVLDDMDSVFDNEMGVNLLKAAIDTKEERWVSYLSQAKALKNAEIENKFKFEGRILFITNEDFQREAMLKTKKGVHMDAFLNRTTYIDLLIRSPRQVMLWIEKRVREKNILVNQKGITDNQQEEVLTWLRQRYSEVFSLSLRTAVKIAGYMLIDPFGWQSLAEVGELEGSAVMHK